MNRNGLTPGERRTFQALKNPGGIQRFLDSLPYNLEPDGPTCRSPRVALREGTAHCFEGALLAAAALRVLGFPPLVLDLEAVRDDDHVLAVFRRRGHWGAIGKSNYSGLRFREPVYRTLRELAMSYFDHYFNLKGEKTLRRYSVAVNLRRFDRIAWMTSEEELWAIPEHLCTIRHYDLLRASMERSLNRMDARTFAAGMVGSAKKQPGYRGSYRADERVRAGASSGGSGRSAGSNRGFQRPGPPPGSLTW